ncbi:MAG: branched-chain amino acid ABC transporter ATP-binding protein/permease [Alphaproteobacteria bacterium]
MSAASAKPKPVSRGAYLPWLAGAALLTLYAAFMGDIYGLRLLTQAGIYALLVIGYQFVFGHTGAFSLAQGAFFGLGAYVTGILGAKLGWGFLATFPLSILLPAAFALLVAAPVLRLETHYFALATLGLAQVVLIGAVNWEALTGGANGLVGVPRVSLFGAQVAPGWPLLLFVWGLVALSGLLAWRLTRGMRGLMYRTLRERPLAAASVGLDGGALRAVAFVLSAAYGGAAGALHANSLGVVSPEVFDFSIMVACLTMAVVGGRTRIAGAILGAVLLIHLPEWLRGLEQYYLIAYGAALLLVVILAPDGLAGLVDLLWRRRARGAHETLPFVPARASGAPAGGAVLHIEHVAKSFGGVAALDGVSLRVAPGEVVGLIGPNGSGKSTLANIVTGLYRADQGHIRLDETALERLRPHEIARLGVARSFQTAELIGDASLIDNIAVAFACAREPLALARGRALTALAQAGLSERAWLNASSQPAGVRRLAEIARATARRPRLLVLDEPSASLTDDERATLARLLRGFAGNGLAILVIDHNVPFLAGLAGRLVCLEAGRVIAAGTPDAVLADPAVRRAYLGTAKDTA